MTASLKQYELGCRNVGDRYITIKISERDSYVLCHANNKTVLRRY